MVDENVVDDGLHQPSQKGGSTGHQRHHEDGQHQPSRKMANVFAPQAAHQFDRRSVLAVYVFCKFVQGLTTCFDIRDHNM